MLRPPRTKRHRTNRSIRTEQAYVDWIKRYILFHNKRHPNEMGSREIEAFLTYLAVEQNVAASTQDPCTFFDSTPATRVFVRSLPDKGPGQS